MSTHDAAENNFKKTYRTYRNTKNNTIGKKLQIKTDSSRLFRPCKHSTSQSHSRIASKSGLWLHFNVFRRLNLVFDKTLMMQCCHFSAKLSHLGGCKCVRMQNQTWILLHPVFAPSWTPCLMFEYCTRKLCYHKDERAMRNILAYECFSCLFTESD